MYVIKSLDYRVLRQRDMNVDGALAAQRSKSLSGSFTRAFSKYTCIIVLLISMGLLDSMINDVIWVMMLFGSVGGMGQHAVVRRAWSMPWVALMAKRC